MPNMTLAIPEDLHALMKKQSDINWSEVARKAIKERAETLALLDKLLEKSKMTEKDAEIIGNSIKRGAYKRFLDANRGRLKLYHSSADKGRSGKTDHPQNEP